MCRRTVWLNAPKDDFVAACKDRRIGAERAELLWVRLNEIAKEREEKQRKEAMEAKAKRLEAQAEYIRTNPYHTAPQEWISD